MEIINLQPDVYSVLTNISAIETPNSTPRSICLHTDERFIGFQRNDNPNIAKYMETKVEKIGWEKYKHQCWKYGIPPIRAIKECLNGESNLNLAVSIVIQLSFVIEIYFNFFKFSITFLKALEYRMPSKYYLNNQILS